MSRKQKIDILEESILRKSKPLLDILLKDMTTGKNIIWATSSYKYRGKGFSERDEISPSCIIGKNRKVIMPRIAKQLEEQTLRTKDKAEVFTPAWVCNEQNNLVDSDWFGRECVFNISNEKSWTTYTRKITFPRKKGKRWRDYVTDNRLEVTCGEAPYLVSRYDTVTGEFIQVKNRIGILDRKMRIVNERNNNFEEWYYWAKKAFQSVYGYEFQGDNLLLARENLLYTFSDNMKYKFSSEPKISQLKEIAEIIVWNTWQMDGFTYTVPYKKTYLQENLTLFNMLDKQENFNCKIKDWKENKVIEFKSLIEG